MSDEIVMPGAKYRSLMDGDTVVVVCLAVSLLDNSSVVCFTGHSDGFAGIFNGNNVYSLPVKSFFTLYELDNPKQYQWPQR